MPWCAALVIAAPPEEESMSIARPTWIIALAGLALGCGSTVTVTSPDAGAVDVGVDVGAPALDGGAPMDVPLDVRTSCLLPGGGVCLVGQSCPHPDGCNTCSCYGGGEYAACTLIGCVPPDAGPSVDGQAPIDAGGCRSSADCGPDRECRFSEPGCGLIGACGFITDCAAIVPFCGCAGETFLACPTAPERPWVTRGACERDGGAATDVPPSPDSAVCGGASLGRGGGYCAGPADGPLPVTCCTGWNCDERGVLCDGIPPTCPAGEVRTVTAFACYGPCVPATHCAPIPCGAGCLPGWTCDATTATCRRAP